MRNPKTSGSRPHIAHALEVRERLPDLVKGLLLLVRLPLDLLAVLICSSNKHRKALP